MLRLTGSINTNGLSGEMAQVQLYDLKKQRNTLRNLSLSQEY